MIEIINKYNNTKYTNEIIEYGIKAICLNLLNIITILLIGYITNNLYFSVIFLISFVPMRLILGGYHCNSVIKCEVCFSVIYFIIQLINTTILKKYIIVLFCLTFGMFIREVIHSKLHLSFNSKIIMILYTIIIILLKGKQFYFNLLLSTFYCYQHLV